jgi:hypothetical protein
MRLPFAELQRRTGCALQAAAVPDRDEIAWAAVWLEACGYGGVALLAEALRDERRSLPLVRDALGIDLDHVSCVFLAPAILHEVEAGGRAFLRNVRHGLFLLPFSVRANLGIGCPVDPAFALGGPRHKNPYAEKLLAAEQDGVEVGDAAMAALAAASGTPAFGPLGRGA